MRITEKTKNVLSHPVTGGAAIGLGIAGLIYAKTQGVSPTVLAVTMTALAVGAGLVLWSLLEMRMDNGRNQ